MLVSRADLTRIRPEIAKHDSVHAPPSAANGCVYINTSLPEANCCSLRVVLKETNETFEAVFGESPEAGSSMLPALLRTVVAVLEALEALNLEFNTEPTIATFN